MNDAVLTERAAVLAKTSDRGLAACRELSDATDRWLAGVFETAVAHTSADSTGVALVALGGYGRRELAPRSDIDVVLLHDKAIDVTELAEQVWYPVWDDGVKLGHSVRTVAETLDLARSDLITATSILSSRLIAGDEVLATDLLEGGLAAWSKANKRYLADLYEKMRQRRAEHGELAFLLEPDIKEARGGLRDIHAMGWAETTEAWIPDVDRASVDNAYSKLNDVRVALHSITGRPSNRLLLELQDEVATQLDYENADALMADVAAAGRSVLWTSNGVFNRIHRSLRGRRLRGGKPREVAPGVILEDRRVHLDRRNHATLDPLAPLRIAVAAATHQAFIERETLSRLAEETPVLSNPWPDEARGLLTDLLLTGKAAIPVWEALDQVGLIVKLIPEWEPCRSRPQRNAYHRFTVDRHLVEAAAEAASLADRVDRPDLLVLGALLHDIGKGYEGDHTVVGVELVATIAPRMGFDDDETTALVDMVRHHLLLPDVATRRDLDDDGTLRHIADQVENVELLELLHALTEADSIATGPAAWGSWKAELVATLVERTSHLLLGGHMDDVVDSSFPTAEHLLLIEKGQRHIAATDNTLTVVSPDRPGLFAQVAGVLALNGVDILEASVHSEAGIGLEVFRVAYSHAESVPWPCVIADVETALSGGLAIAARLAERASVYRKPRPRTAQPVAPSVAIDNSISTVSTVIEVSCPDEIGVLYRIVRSFLQFDIDVVGAKVQTLMHDGVDTFYVRSTSGDKITDPAVLAEIERAVMYSLDN